MAHSLKQCGRVAQQSDTVIPSIEGESDAVF